ncbi:MAG: hypothetical protein V4718_04290 [Pseudomonadota bacterium]
MRNLPVLLVLTAMLSGCAVGGTDMRFLSVPKATTTVEGYPIYVKVLKVENAPGIFDVEVGDDRAIAFTGLNEPLATQARFRQAAESELRKTVGAGSVIKEVSAHAPTGFQIIFLRYSVS